VGIRHVAGAVALSLVFVGCSSSSSKGTASSGTKATSSPTTVVGDQNAYALKYTGGTAGAASGAPYKIGYVSQDSFLPGATVGADAAVAYINAELGGVGGRPIDLVKCPVSNPQDAAACGSRLANDPSISLVITGAVNTGNKELYDALAGKKAVLIANGLANEDFTTKVGVSFTAGSPGVLSGIAQFVAQDLQAKTVAVLLSDNPGGRAAAQLLLKPVFDKVGAQIRQVFVSTTATAPEVASLIQATKADSADAFIAVVDPPNCLNVYDSLQTLGIHPKVVTTDLCASQAMQDHLKSAGASGKVPDGWYYANYGYNYDLPDAASGMEAYLAKIYKYGKVLPGASAIDPTGFTGPTFAVVMSAAKILNQVGVDKASFTTLDSALRGFTGPQMLQVGPLKCGVPLFVANCAHEIGIDQYTGGKWISVRDGLNGKPIDLTAS
jgi:branched-chain amino acid transport system substrate-binding protein